MIVVLLIEHFTDAVAQSRVSCNLRHDCSLEGPIVNVKLDDYEVSWLTYAAYYVERMRGLPEVVCDWGVVEMQPAHLVLSRPPWCPKLDCSLLASAKVYGMLLDIKNTSTKVFLPTSACTYREHHPSTASAPSRTLPMPR